MRPTCVPRERDAGRRPFRCRRARCSPSRRSRRRSNRGLPTARRSSGRGRVTRRLRVTWPDPEPFARGGASIQILAVSDEPEAALDHARNRDEIGPIDLVVGCGDLASDYLNFLADAFHVHLVRVLGNHDRPAVDQEGGIVARTPSAVGSSTAGRCRSSGCHGPVVRPGATSSWPGARPSGSSWSRGSVAGRSRRESYSATGRGRRRDRRLPRRLAGLSLDPGQASSAALAARPHAAGRRRRLAGHLGGDDDRQRDRCRARRAGAAPNRLTETRRIGPMRRTTHLHMNESGPPLRCVEWQRADRVHPELSRSHSPHRRGRADRQPSRSRIGRARSGSSTTNANIARSPQRPRNRCP